MDLGFLENWGEAAEFDDIYVDENIEDFVEELSPEDILYSQTYTLDELENNNKWLVAHNQGNNMVYDIIRDKILKSFNISRGTTLFNTGTVSFADKPYNMEVPVLTQKIIKTWKSDHDAANTIDNQLASVPITQFKKILKEHQLARDTFENNLRNKLKKSSAEMMELPTFPQRTTASYAQQLSNDVLKYYWGKDAKTFIKLPSNFNFNKVFTTILNFNTTMTDVYSVISTIDSRLNNYNDLITNLDTSKSALAAANLTDKQVNKKIAKRVVNELDKNELDNLFTRLKEVTITYQYLYPIIEQLNKFQEIHNSINEIVNTTDLVNVNVRQQMKELVSRVKYSSNPMEIYDKSGQNNDDLSLPQEHPSGITFLDPNKIVGKNLFL